MISDNDIEKLRVRFVSALKWINLHPYTDVESLQLLVQKCRRNNMGACGEIVYQLSQCAEHLILLQTNKTNTSYSRLINALGELDSLLKATPPQKIDNVCVALR